MPGVLSEDLRKALGLKKRQLPAHIYRMRVLGYPPGWLEAAKVKHSGISLFDSCGKKILESDEEDGEVDFQKDKYDIRKIHSFPGFNVEPEENYYDVSKSSFLNNKNSNLKNLVGFLVLPCPTDVRRA